MFNNNKRSTVWGVLVLVVLVVLVLKVVWIKKSEGLSVILLSGGEVYVGDLSLFPKMKLKNGYILTTDKDGNYQLSPLTEALWAPKYLYLNKKQVVFYGPISDDSRVAISLQEKKAEPAE